MSLLGCLVSISLAIALMAPVMQSSAALLTKQSQLEKAWLVEQDAIRVLELMARAIRMAGYRKIASLADYRQRQRIAKVDYIGLEYRGG
jgi:Tfp pilus assembly protein PilW